ncbi:MAG: N-acetylmuramoyl-L-alanine amidase, partial [Hyphomicrobiales bacterium]|nr:N-acetylmuramoyl-L-alanine amidase [Hyphomicrobiales bacterium]
PTDNDLPTIVLDPGHGGIDTGAKGRQGAVEKKVTLAFAEILGEKLTETGRYNVLFTRTDDSFVALSDRVGFAQDHNADLFVSIHANSFRGRSIRGAIVYTISDEASDKMAAEIAELENQVDVLAGLDVDADDSDEVRDILLDLTRRETHNFGTVFARNLVKELKATTPMFKVPHQQASFRVLEAPDVPSALIELGFVSNADDEKLLLSDTWRSETSVSIVRAIEGFFETKVAQRGLE